MFASLGSMFSFRKKTAEDKRLAAQDKEARRKKEILARQGKLLRQEINQTWRIAVGKELPKKLKDTHLVKDITRRNVWMEDNYVFNQIKKEYPGEIFHSIDKYILKWQPPGSHFQIIVPLDDPDLQENAIMVVSRLRKRERKKIVFLFTTLDPHMDMFAPRVHPASLVSYRTKIEVLQKLSDLFLEGKITVQEVEQVFTCEMEVWRVTLYNLLPEDEQVYHTYLMEKLKPAEVKSLHRKYLDDDITLKEYEELKFPDRTKRKYIESLTYPLPIEGQTCIICSQPHVGVVRCHTCENMVCKSCILDVFHGRSRRQESYLLMHHKYCMKLGELPEIVLDAVPDDAFLREFRDNSRLAVIKRFQPKTSIEEEDESLLLAINEEEQAKRLAEAQRLQELAEAEERQRLLENPPELQEKRQFFEDKRRKWEKYKRELLDYNDKVADTSHTEQYIARHRRLRAELVIKIRKHTLGALTSLQQQLALMSLPGEYLSALQRTVTEVMDEIEELLDESIDDVDNADTAEAVAAAGGSSNENDNTTSINNTAQSQRR